jgi:itaconyl-CoA hydratase
MSRCFEDFEVGQVFRSHLGRTVSEADNTWFTLLTVNTNQLHFNADFASRTEFGRPLVVSTLTLAIVVGLSVADTSENALANLGWGDIRLPAPVFAGDTLWAESEVTLVRPSGSRPHCGIVGIRTRGVNQDGDVVVEFTRSFMVYRREAMEERTRFPAPTAPWGV